MWKPGQIVTINHKKYRVKSAPHGYLPCVLCALCCNISILCDPICFSENYKLGKHQYLELMEPKSQGV
jgi:hypothetical protein